MFIVHTPRKNHLLDELDDVEFERIKPYLEMVRLCTGDIVYHQGGELAHVYFPTTAIISLGYVMENGNTSEIASVGNEGVLGISLFMGGQSTPGRAVVQASGHAYRLSAARLLEEFYRKGPLLGLLLRYTHVLMTQVSQSVVCNAHHSSEQRLCRWLLQTMDRTHGAPCVMTQEAIAAILGVRREAITDAASHLQSLGLIQYRRGHVNVIDRHGLEARVCECYEVLRRESRRLLADRQRRQQPVVREWRKRDGAETRRRGSNERRMRSEESDTGVAQPDTQASFDFTALSPAPHRSPER